MKKWTDSYSRSFPTHFNITFARSGPKRHGQRLFITDNDPSQRSKVAKRALQDIEAELHEIPPRSPDINVIESIFHLLRVDLEEEAAQLLRTLLVKHLNNSETAF